MATEIRGERGPELVTIPAGTFIPAASMALAWDEGHRDGCDDNPTMCREMGHLERNPYRVVD